jgi:hypothetical protein
VSSVDAHRSEEEGSSAMASAEVRRARFRARLQRGLAAERQIGHDLFDQGYWVSWPNPVSTLDGEGFSPTQPDLLVDIGTRCVGIEVKGPSISFSGPDDYPYALALVGGIERWDRREDDPDFVVIVSMTEMAGRIVVPCRTRPRWRRVVVGGKGPSWGAPRSCWRTWEWLLERLLHPTV